MIDSHTRWISCRGPGSALKDMADDIEWIEPGNSTVSGTYRDKDEIARFFTTLASKSFRTEPQHFIADGDHVVVLTPLLWTASQRTKQMF
jgi:ketosteroid isomerase-like protein